MADPTQQKRDLTLADLEYAFTQDVTTGKVKVYNGSTVVNPTAQEVLVKYDPKTGDYNRCNNPEDARCKSIGAEEGEYAVLRNPSTKEKYPAPSTTQGADELENGRRIVLPGPKFFALWPGQSAEVIKGHHLKSNQFLLVRIYHEELAKKNWGMAIMRPAAPALVMGEDGKPLDPQPATTSAAPTAAPPVVDLTIGKLHIIKGTEVSFFIPPSGVEVVRDEKGQYVRDALTLERMEYCILVDESGTKRYERGPQVVFPTPTEKFHISKDGANKEKAVELSEIQGIHKRAQVSYEDKELGTKFLAGHEYFITGVETLDDKNKKVGNGVGIYYPREELAFIRYDGKTKHFGVAVAKGQGRYVLHRQTAEIETVKGPTQLLPNPITKVIVRRVLSDRQCDLFYPNSLDAKPYNQALRGAAAASPTTRAGALSEGDFERAAKSMMKSAKGPVSEVIRSAVSNYVGETSKISGDQRVMGDEFERQSTFTKPRMIQLSSEYEGAVVIGVWVGYAIMIISENSRKVEVGPKRVMLEYDEDLEVLSFSTGKPKTTDNLLSTVYLQVQNNKVSDVIEVESVEGVKAQVYVSYLVNFEGDSSKWFNVSNYIKLLCDRARSMLKGTIRKVGIENFFTNSTDIVRDTLLGKHVDGARDGLSFEENGMRVRDVDVLGVAILHPPLAQRLQASQLQVIDTNLNLAAKRRELEQTREVERIEQETVKVQAETQKLRDSIEIDLVKSATEKLVAESEGELTKYQKQFILAKSINEKEDLVAAAGLARAKAEADQALMLAQLTQTQRIELLNAEKDAVVAKLAALKDGYGEILGALSERDVLVKMTEAQNLLNLVHKDAKSEALVTSIIEMRQLKEVLNGATRGIVPAAAVMPRPPA